MTRRLTLRSEEDLLALIPCSLGFHPEESLVMTVVTSTGLPFHARVDLPTSGEECDVVSAQLTTAALRNDGRQALLAAYTDDVCLALVTVDALAQALDAAGIRVVCTIRADRGRWYPLFAVAEDATLDEGIAYDVSAHPLTAESVLEGKVTHLDRHQLVSSLTAHDPDLVDAVAEAHAGLTALAGDDRATVGEGAWLVEWVRAGVAAPHPVMGSAEVARVLRALQDKELRDLGWCEISREDADAHVELWRTVVRASPVELVAPPAALLAFAAWQAGDGALAWCAVDRALEADPDYYLARLVHQALEMAVPPTRWTPPAAGQGQLTG